MAASLYIGLMSGTSMDGVDGVVMDMEGTAQFRVLAHHHQPFSAALRQTLDALNRSGPGEIHRAALAANALARVYAQVVASLLAAAGIPRDAVDAVGAHGQTVRHRPGEFDNTGYTCQLLNGALLAELCGIDVVCDFRSRDVAAGGQGAPLVPAFHRAAFSMPGKEIALLNLGGIANLTLLHGDGTTSGHDTGPGNVLMDAWCGHHTGQPYDDEGRWAATGTPSSALLARWMQEPFFARKPPKSTGRDLFDAAWLLQQQQTNGGIFRLTRPEDVQATLGLLTARTVANDLRRFMPSVERLVICGGGAYNRQLVRLIAEELPAVEVTTIDQISPMHPMHVEAAAFAWLAAAFRAHQPSNCVAVTGAGGPRILGALYPC